MAPYVAANPEESGAVVAQVKKHTSKCMAYIAFVAPEFAQAIVSQPPDTLCGVAVLPPRQHSTDPNSIVVKWQDGVLLQESDIAAELDAIFTGAEVPPPANVVGPKVVPAKRPMQVQPSAPGGGGHGGAVRKVAKHATKPLAFVAFQSVELVQAVLANQPNIRRIGGVAIDPFTPHRTEPDTLCIFWRPGPNLPERAIAEYFEQLAAPMIGGGHASPSAPSGEQQFIEGVKKHPTKSMAFITFKLEEVTQAALMEASTITSLGEVAIDPLVPHKSDPRSVILYWKGPSGALSAESIADFFESFMAELFGYTGGEQPAQPVVVPARKPPQKPVPPQRPQPQRPQPPPQQLSWVEEATAVPDEGSVEVTLESIAASIDYSKPLVVALKKHPNKTMAYVTFQTMELAQVALQDPDPPRQIGPATIEPIRPHNTDPFSIVVFWHPGVELGPEDVAGHYEWRLATLLGQAEGTPAGVEDASMGLGMGAGQPFVAKVKTSPQKKTAFVTFQSADIAQVVMQDPHAMKFIGSVKIDPLEFHRADPSTVVLWWKQVPDLPIPVIQQCFEAYCAELLGAPAGPQLQAAPMTVPPRRPAAAQSWESQTSKGGTVRAPPQSLPSGPGGKGGKGGKGWKGGKGPPMLGGGGGGGGGVWEYGAPGAPPQPTQSFTSEDGVRVKKHGGQPMAFVTFPTEELAQALLLAPPSDIAGVAILPPRPHKSDSKAIVIRWDLTSGVDLPEESIAQCMSECLALAMTDLEGVAAGIDNGEDILGQLGEEGQELEQEAPAARKNIVVPPRKRPAEVPIGGSANGRPAVKARLMNA